LILFHFLAQLHAIFGSISSNLHPHEQEPHQQNPLKFKAGTLLAMLNGQGSCFASQACRASVIDLESGLE
jgi:hypothetical protein